MTAGVNANVTNTYIVLHLLFSSQFSLFFTGMPEWALIAPIYIRVCPSISQFWQLKFVFSTFQLAFRKTSYPIRANSDIPESTRLKLIPNETNIGLFYDQWSVFGHLLNRQVSRITMQYPLKTLNRIKLTEQYNMIGSNKSRRKRKC